MDNGEANGKGVFVQHRNPLTGKSQWKVLPEDYDYQQEVARAAFADMLHDSERVIKRAKTKNHTSEKCTISPFRTSSIIAVWNRRSR